MITVIKQAYRKEKARITCPVCHSILEYQKEDIQNSGFTLNSNDYWIDCPVCNSAIIVDPNKDFPWIDPVGYYEDN